jgi:hypothetical protein
MSTGSSSVSLAASPTMPRSSTFRTSSFAPNTSVSGVGRQLLTVCLERYSHVRQKVLLTDDDEVQQRFSESLGYVKATNFTAAPLNAYVRFDT